MIVFWELDFLWQKILRVKIFLWDSNKEIDSQGEYGIDFSYGLISKDPKISFLKKEIEELQKEVDKLAREESGLEDDFKIVETEMIKLKKKIGMFIFLFFVF